MASKMIQMQDIQSDISSFLHLIRTGTEVVLIEDGKAIAKVIPSVASKTARIAGLHLGSIAVSDDFDEPLSDGFWLGTE